MMEKNRNKKKTNKIDKNVKIIVATHKEYQVAQDKAYFPLHVGADSNKNKTNFVADNTGQNISIKNPNFCELTGMYWAWKNLQADYIGLVHYRRYFTLSHKRYRTESEKFKNVLTTSDLNQLLEKNNIILPKKRRYYIETLYNHYKHTMNIEPLDITGEIIKEKFPSYYPEFKKLHTRRSAHMFNMFVMDKNTFDDYCKWLFTILFELEKKIDFTKYNTYQARFFGNVSERLLDVYINTNHIKYKEVRVMDMQKINWFNKVISFLKAKFLGDKYDKSF